MSTLTPAVLMPAPKRRDRDAARRRVRAIQSGGDMPPFEPDAVHVPVLLDEVMHHLAPHGVVLDLTVGAGGHTGVMLSRYPQVRVIGIDRDAEILGLAGRNLAPFCDRVTLHRATFDRLDDVLAALGVERVDGVLIDLGVSSLQLDVAGRGFSFDEDGPLDMRMDPSQGRSAADFINRATREELLHAIGGLGDEPMAGRIVAAILEARGRAPLRRTCELTDLVARVVRQPRHHHPATRTFMGLRMVVNDELGALERVLPRALGRLAPGGRLVVIAFHSGEDRIVKRFFKAAAAAGEAHLLNGKPVSAGPDEIARNPRARSARLRAMSIGRDP